MHDLEVLRTLIPPALPILVDHDDDGFKVTHLDGDDLVRNAKYHIAYTAITAFMRGWRDPRKEFITMANPNRPPTPNPTPPGPPIATPPPHPDHPPHPPHPPTPGPKPEPEPRE